MASHTSSGTSTGTAGGDDPVPASGSGAPATGSGVTSGTDRVDTALIDRAAERFQVVQAQLARLAQHAEALASYRPTKGGVNDSTWSSFVNQSQGYGDSTADVADALKSLGGAMQYFHDGLKGLSTMFTRIEGDAVQTAASLDRAFTPPETTASAAPTSSAPHGDGHFGIPLPRGDR